MFGVMFVSSVVLSFMKGCLPYLVSMDTWTVCWLLSCCPAPSPSYEGGHIVSRMFACMHYVQYSVFAHPMDGEDPSPRREEQASRGGLCIQHFTSRERCCLREEDMLG